MNDADPAEPIDPARDAEDADEAPDVDAQPDDIDERDEDATAVCLRCFAPLLGAPTRCANCGAPASLSATLGPVAGGGVDAGGRTLSSLETGAESRFSPWSVAVLWGLGIVLLPLAAGWALEVRFAFGGPFDGIRPPLVLWLGIFVVWTVYCGWAFARARASARAAREAPKGP